MRRANAFDLRSHRHQQVAQVDDFGLPRRVEQLRFSLGEDCGHQRILGRPNRHNRKAEVAAGKASLGCARLHIACGQLDFGAHGLKRLKVEVDWAVADCATAGQRHRGLSHPCEHRPKNQDRGAHFAHHVVGCDRRDDLLGL